MLTALTVMLALLLFVAGPLQAAGIVAAHYLGLAFGLSSSGGGLIVSGSGIAVGSILIAIGLVACSDGAAAATALRDRHIPRCGCLADRGDQALSVVVAQAVFAAGKVTFHRIIGAVLLYLVIGLIFVALFCFVGLIVPKAFTGCRRYRTTSPLRGIWPILAS